MAVLGVFCLKWHKYLVVNDDIIEHFSRRQNIGKQENRQISSYTKNNQKEEKMMTLSKTLIHTYIFSYVRIHLCFPPSLC